MIADAVWALMTRQWSTGLVWTAQEPTDCVKRR